MTMISDWRRVVAVSLSFWMQVFGLVALILPEVVFAATGRDSDPAFLWWFAVLLLVAGLAGRLLKQGVTKVREQLRLCAVAGVLLLLAFVLTLGTAGAASAAAASEAATLKIAVPFIAKEEGKRNKAYLDVVGVPTICYGSTRGIRLGMVMSDRECTALLRAEVAEYREGLHRHFSTDTKQRRMTPERDTAFTSLAFNAGIRAIGRSTATRRLNAGNIAGGCKALTWWNKAGGRVIRGLVNRRAREYRHCMAGLR